MATTNDTGAAREITAELDALITEFVRLRDRYEGAHPDGPRFARNLVMTGAAKFLLSMMCAEAEVNPERARPFAAHVVASIEREVLGFAVN